MPDVDSISGLPVGARVDRRVAGIPQAVTLPGHFGSVEGLNWTRHRESLWRAVGRHGHLFTYMAFGPFADEQAFSDWLVECAQSQDPRCFVVLDPAGEAAGIAALMTIRPDMRVVEIGNVVLAPAIQRTPVATQAQYLLARYVFDMLGYRRYEWKCDALNAASRHAAVRLGFSFEGIFRDHMIVKGRNRDTAWFALLAEDWPSRKAACECWLDPQNFNPDGTQRETLRAIRQRLDAAAQD